MKALELHPWQVSSSQAQAIQRELAGRVLTQKLEEQPQFIAGVDISPGDEVGMTRGAVVVLTFPDLEVAEVRVAEVNSNFPYIPGLLSFREIPALLPVLEQLDIRPDLLLVDGQGLAHPRRFGLACHLGVLLDLPTIGCAKSRLVGSHNPVGVEVGDWAKVEDRGERVGLALRSKSGARPLYISAGHKIDLEGARRWVMACCRGHRLPEPIRLAHLAAAGRLAPGVREPAQAKAFAV